MNQISFEIVGEPVAQGRQASSRKKLHRQNGSLCSGQVPGLQPICEAHRISVLTTRAHSGSNTLGADVLSADTEEVSDAAETGAYYGGGLLPTTKPDVDNLAKGVKDGLSKTIWQDDSEESV